MKLSIAVVLGALSEDALQDLAHDVANEQHLTWRRSPIKDRVPWDALEQQVYIEFGRRARAAREAA